MSVVLWPRVKKLEAKVKNIDTFSLKRYESYSSCEPCPMCLAAIYWSRLDRIYYAATCDDAAAGFDDRNFSRELGEPTGERAIPMEQALGEEACVGLKKWMNKEDRIRY